MHNHTSMDDTPVRTIESTPCLLIIDYYNNNAFVTSLFFSNPERDFSTLLFQTDKFITPKKLQKWICFTLRNYNLDVDSSLEI